MRVINLADIVSLIVSRAKVNENMETFSSNLRGVYKRLISEVSALQAVGAREFSVECAF